MSFPNFCFCTNNQTKDCQMNSIMEKWMNVCTKLEWKCAQEWIWKLLIFQKKNFFKHSYKREAINFFEMQQEDLGFFDRCRNILLGGKPIFEKLRISDGSLDIWREIYREPQGVSKSYSVHLAELELNPTEDYEWFAEPIDSADVAEKTRLLDNGSAAGIDRFSKENLAHVGTKALVNWFNRFLEVGASPKALKQFGSPKTPKRYRMVLIPKFKGAAYPKDYR